MREIKMGSTGIVTPQNGFGALPIQRISLYESTKLLRTAVEWGMTYFDTARAYSDSEGKIGAALEEVRDDIYIATKTMAQTPEAFWDDLHTSLKNLKTDYIDVYQFHCAPRCFRPDDGTGMYEAMLEAKQQGKVLHIGITAHLLPVASEAVDSGLYETLQFPFSYLSGEQELELVRRCRENNMGFVAMKGMAGGLINRSDAAMAFMHQFDNVVPIWGIQREEELGEWVDYMEETPTMTPEIEAFIEAERAELAEDFCRGCGYCMPCPQNITISQCARMSLMVRRAPSQAWLTEFWQAEMEKTQDCTECRACVEKCPYSLPIPELLQKNYADYQQILAGEIAV